MGKSPVTPYSTDFTGTWQVSRYIDSYDSPTNNNETVETIITEENITNDFFTITDNAIISYVTNDSCSAQDTFTFTLSGNQLTYVELQESVTIGFTAKELVFFIDDQNNSSETLRTVYCRPYYGAIPPANWPQACTTSTAVTHIIPWTEEEIEEVDEVDSSSVDIPNINNENIIQ
jgi:hypothetical protein